MKKQKIQMCTMSAVYIQTEQRFFHSELNFGPYETCSFNVHSSSFHYKLF